MIVSEEVFSHRVSIATEILGEMGNADRYGPFRSLFEGWAIFKEEADEMWDALKGKNEGPQEDRRASVRKEAIQTAAMAMKLIEAIDRGAP